MSTKRRQYTPQEEDQILDLQKQGIPRETIAEIVRVPITKVHKLLRSRGVTLGAEKRAANRAAGRVAAKNYPSDVAARVRDLYGTMTVQQIAEKLGVSDDKVLTEARRQGLRVTDLQRSMLHTKYGTEVKQAVAQARQEGAKLEDIATSLELSPSTVKYIVQSAGVVLTPQQRNDIHSKLLAYDAEKELEALRYSGIARAHLAEMFGLSERSIKSILTSLGITIPMEVRQKNARSSKTQEQVSAFVAAGRRPEVVARRTAAIRLTWQDESMVAEARERGIRRWQDMDDDERLSLLARMRSAWAASPRVQAYMAQLKTQTASANKPLQAILRDQGFASAEERLHYWASQNGGTFVGPYSTSQMCTKWRCKEGHEFSMRPNSVQQGQWCPMCCWNGPSRGQRELYDFVLKHCPDAVLDDKTVIRPKELDIWVPSKKFAIEYHGLFWHSSYAPGFTRNATAQKVRLAWQAGASIFVVFEDEWRDRRPLVEDMILHRLGLAAGEKLNARALVLRRMDNGFEHFFERNHLAGNVRAAFAWGLFRGEELMSCASFRPDGRGGYEVARFANKRGCVVRGAAGRILSPKCQPGPLFSYSDNRISQGGVYQRIGWSEDLDKDPRPGYWYLDDRFDHRLPRQAHMKSGRPEMMAIGSTEQEQQNALGFHRIEDAGCRKWIRPTSSAISPA